MAQTPAAVQAVLGASAMNATIVWANESQGALSSGVAEQQWYVRGNADAPGRDRAVTTTASNSAAAQAAAILVALRA